MDGEVELLGERIAEQAAHLDAATHRLLTDLREFDARGGWHTQGAKSCAHWLAWRVGWTLGTARQRVRVAVKLGELAATDDARRRGGLSYPQVRAILRVATPANEAMLLETARLSCASQLETLCRKYATVQAHCRESSPRDDVQRRHVRRRDTADGMVKIEATLHPEEAELVWSMLDHVAKHLAREPGTAGVSAEPSAVGASPCAGQCPVDVSSGTAGVSAEPSVQSRRVVGPLQRAEDATRRAFDRADALMAITQAHLRGAQLNRTPIDVVVTIPMSELRSGADDPTAAGCMGSAGVSAETVRRISCDAGVIEVVEDAQGVPLSVGRKRRAIAGSIKRALLKRDRTCTFPGCTHGLFLEGHHVRHWADGGETSLENGLMLCSQHHRFLHEYGYQIEFGADQRPEFRDPRGRLVPAVPVRPAPVDLGWPHLRAAHDGLGIDASTHACEWNGKPMRYGAMVSELVTADGLR